MCYDINFLTKGKNKYAKRFADTDHDIHDLEDQLTLLGEHIVPHYHVSGFEHPEVPVITNEEPGQIQLINWGLIPRWTKDMQAATEISNRTLNARSETMFDKPAFREPAKSNHCLVIVDGYFEYHWKNGKSFPYHIFLNNADPMALGGIWDEWEDPATGTLHKTFSIVTTSANPLMHRIHNNPKASIGPRMPLIIPKELEKDWLSLADDPVGKARIEEIMVAYDEEEMDAYTVPRLKGKLAVGNNPKALIETTYDELNFNQGALF